MIKTVLGLLLVATLTLTAAPPQKNETDRPGSKDHPLITRMPDFFINRYQQSEFDQYIFRVGKTRETVEGRLTKISYRIKTAAKPGPSRLAILKNNVNALVAEGASILREERDVQATLKLDRNGQEIWIDIRSFPGSYSLAILEKGEMKQVLTANALFDAIMKDGQVALDIRFDTGKATIRPESAGILQTVESLLRDHPELKLRIEGHTDSSGTPDGNQTLSEARAQAVLKNLVARGTDPSRLVAKGYGQDKPVADNNTEEGRARNRRVTLVRL